MDLDNDVLYVMTATVFVVGLVMEDVWHCVSQNPFHLSRGSSILSDAEIPLWCATEMNVHCHMIVHECTNAHTHTHDAQTRCGLATRFTLQRRYVLEYPDIDNTRQKQRDTESNRNECAKQVVQ